MSAGTPVDVKICGIRTVDDYDACKAAGAAFVGMVFFPRSPRHLSMQEAGTLADHADRYSDGPARVVCMCVRVRVCGRSLCGRFLIPGFLLLGRPRLPSVVSYLLSQNSVAP